MIASHKGATGGGVAVSLCLVNHRPHRYGLHFGPMQLRIKRLIMGRSQFVLGRDSV